MTEAVEHDEQLRRALEELREHGATLEAPASQTIVPPQTETEAQRLLRLLGTFDEAAGKKLELHGTLGEGGMGRVRLATQTALARKVAVKTLREELLGSEAATLKLLREAWVTGSLEHPNVIPIYDVTLGPEGAPQIVLKRVEGTSWEALMHDPAALRARFGVDDPLEWNLRIFMQVCNAIRFAHSRGVLHRDIKPENVMIGAFGEVYVVDWGIAVALEDDGSGRVPLAADATDLAGTPAYMAPEMLGGSPSRLSERSDIYLLGSTLYEIVAGGPPHEGETLMQMVAQIIDSSPPFEDTVPEPLGRIIRRAMDPDPEGRFETAEQVRLAVQGYLRQRDAIALAQKADLRRAALEALLEEEEPTREAVYRAFAECRFGYRHALEVYDGPEAREGLEAVIVRMARYELAQDEPESAHALLTELAEAPADLAEEIARAREAKREDGARLERMRADLDPTAGRRTRAFLALIVGAVWVLMPAGAYLLGRFGYEADLTHLNAIVVDVAILMLFAGLFTWARESLTRTAINRRISFAAFLAVVGQLLLHGVEMAAGGDSLDESRRHQLLVWAAILAVTAAGVDAWLLLPAAGYALGFAILAFFPGAVLLVFGVCNLVLFLTMLRLWGRRDDIDRLGARMREGRAQRRAWVRRWWDGDERT